MSKKALLLSTKNNFTGKLSSLKELERLVIAESLSNYLEQDVDIYHWKNLPTYHDYSRIIVAEKSYLPKNKSRYNKIFSRFLANFSGKINYIDLTHIPGERENNNKFSLGYQKYLDNLDKVIFGDQHSHNLWMPGYKYSQDLNSFDFRVTAKYEEAIIFFHTIKYKNLTNAMIGVDNLIKSLYKIRAKKRILILPIDCGGFEQEFEQVVMKRLGNTDFIIQKLVNPSKWAWRNNVFNFKTKEIYTKGLKRYETQVKSV